VEFQGCRLTYRIEGAGPPLIMIQGVGAHGLALNPQIEILKKYYSCLTFDNRGIGSSQPPGERVSVEQMASDTLAIMDDAGWASAHIVGHSLGGLIALELALMARSRVRSLALLCTFARGAEAVTPGLLWKGLQMRFGPRYFRRRAFLNLVLPPEAEHSRETIEHLSAVIGHDIGDAPPITGRQLLAMYSHDVSERLSELWDIPVLVVNGQKDSIAPPALGRAIAAAIPGSHYVEIPGATHALPIFQPERCAALLLDHLAGAERARGTRNRQAVL
jgi:pimeloyl-ACP methyl ester carboxylesterase